MLRGRNAPLPGAFVMARINGAYDRGGGISRGFA
jgi:hypothetical protein